MTHYSKNHGDLGPGHRQNVSMEQKAKKPAGRASDDDITEGDEAQKQRDKMREQVKAEG